MRDISILQAGAAMRAAMLENYHHIGPGRGAELARQYIYELGQAVKIVHGTKEAAAMLYSAADAVTCDLPIEDFRLPPAQQPDAVAPPAASATEAACRPSYVKRSLAWLNRNSFPFVLGLWAGVAIGGLFR